MYFFNFMYIFNLYGKIIIKQWKQWIIVELNFFNFFVLYSDQIVQQVFDELGLTLTDEVNTLLSL